MTVVIDQIGKQTGTISVFWALESLFVTLGLLGNAYTFDVR